MAMSEQLEAEGGKSLFLTFSLFSFEQLIQQQNHLRSNKSEQPENMFFFLHVSLGLLVYREMLYKPGRFDSFFCVCVCVTLPKVN